MVALSERSRHRTHAVRIGKITMGGGAPVVVQSMTNTDTADVTSTVRQVIELARAGSEIVRITVNNDDAARAVPSIRERLDLLGHDVPLVGDFHYNGHRLLADFPEMAEALAKFRINPGNVGFGEKRDRQFEMMVEAALRFERPVRIGVNWGSLDQDLAARLMDLNAASSEPQPADFVLREALVRSALGQCRLCRAPWPRCRSDRHLGQGQPSAGSRCRLSGAGRSLALCAACRADRGRHGDQGPGRHGGGAGAARAGRYRRHDPRLADTAPGRAADQRGRGVPGAAPGAGLALVHAAGRGLPGLRAHHEHAVPGARGPHPDLAARADAGSGSGAIPASRA